MRLAAGDCCDLLSSATNSSSRLDRFGPSLLALARLLVSSCPTLPSERVARFSISPLILLELAQRARKSIGVVRQGARILEAFLAVRIRERIDKRQGDSKHQGGKDCLVSPQYRESRRDPRKQPCNLRLSDGRPGDVRPAVLAPLSLTNKGFN